MGENSFLKKTLFIFSILMVLVYLGFGITLLYSENIDWLPENTRKTFGIILIAYAIFKAWRAYTQRHVFKNYNDKD